MSPEWRRSQLKHGRPIGGLQDRVAVGLQNLGHELADYSLVLDQQDRLVAGLRRVVGGARRGLLGSLLHAREEDAE